MLQREIEFKILAIGKLLKDRSSARELGREDAGIDDELQMGQGVGCHIVIMRIEIPHGSC